MSILAGVDEIIDRHLRVTSIGSSSPHYKHKTSCIRLSGAPIAGFSASDLVEQMLEKVESNWAESPRREYPGPSIENWRWKKNLDISSRNTSPETKLEKAIARILDHNWVNQIPTASGLFSADADKHRNIDLGHRAAMGRYELIELKVTSDHPLAAAAQLLCYAVLYLFARLHYPERLLRSQELLQATAIDWMVLAPAAYYAPYRLGWLATALQNGLIHVADRRSIPIRLSFQFRQFPACFDGSGDDKTIAPALQAIEAVW